MNEIYKVKTCMKKTIQRINVGLMCIFCVFFDDSSRVLYNTN